MGRFKPGSREHLNVYFCPSCGRAAHRVVVDGFDRCDKCVDQSEVDYQDVVVEDEDEDEDDEQPYRTWADVLLTPFVEAAADIGAAVISIKLDERRAERERREAAAAQLLHEQKMRAEARSRARRAWLRARLDPPIERFRARHPLVRWLTRRWWPGMDNELTEISRSTAALPMRVLATADGPCPVELWVGERGRVHAAVPLGSRSPIHEVVAATQDEALARLSQLLATPRVAGGPRWVPPPTWPAPPVAGWTPFEGWQPDPAWGSAPDGWVFWR